MKLKWVDCKHRDAHHDLVDEQDEVLLCVEPWCISQELFDAIPKLPELQAENTRLKEALKDICQNRCEGDTNDKCYACPKTKLERTGQ